MDKLPYFFFSVELLELIRGDSVVLLYSNELLTELVEVAQRKKMRRYFVIDELIKLLDRFDLYAEKINIVSSTSLSRDKDDNFLIDLAIDGKADYLISGDKDLLVLKSVGGTKITTLANFIKEVS